MAAEDAGLKKFLEENVDILESRSISLLLTKLRDKNTNCKEFNFYGDRLMRILAEEALARLPSVKNGTVETPCGSCDGILEGNLEKLCIVSIPRSGDILQEAVRQICPGVGIGKILIQRNEKTAEKTAELYYKKLPRYITECHVILVDPMLATGGSAKCAIKVMIDEGVKEENILFLNLICCPEGLRNLYLVYPKIKVVTCCVDERLDEHKFIVPGLGDYGDRYYGTV